MRRDAPLMCHNELRTVRREKVRRALGGRQDQAAARGWKKNRKGEKKRRSFAFMNMIVAGDGGGTKER